MTRFFSAALVMLLSLLFPTNIARAQDNFDILGATVLFVRASGQIDTSTSPVIMVDPRILIRGGPGSVPGPNDPTHAAALLTAVNSEGRAQSVPLDRAIQCQLVAPEDCPSNGIAYTMRLGRPIINGDSASIEIMAHATRTRPSADSLAKLTPQQRGVANRSWRSAFHAQVHLVKRDGKWVGTRLQLLRATE